MLRIVFCWTLLFISSLLVPSHADPLLARLNALPEITAIEIDSLLGFDQHFEFQIRQPVDHANPNGPSFTQKVYLAHRDIYSPMVMIHQGYAASSNREAELTKLLEANQIRIEHRYFDESRPDSLDWRYMTVKQAAADEYRIVRTLKAIYEYPWINTGISKGGQSALYFRYFYPEAVVATVAYVAPLNLAVEDPRLNSFLKEVGSKECRDNIKTLQRRLLEHREELIPMIAHWSATNDDPLKFGAAASLEYAVMEYSFAFWQSGGNCETLPAADASAEALYDNLVKTVGFSLFAESGARRFSPFFYQAYHELGYYNFNVSHISDLLEVVTDSSNIVFVPGGIRPAYKAETMQSVHKWLQSEARNVLCIYGETDAWSATAVDPGDNKGVLKMVKAGGAHGTRIASFSEEDQEMMLNTLKGEWLPGGMPASADSTDDISGFKTTLRMFDAIMLLGIVMFVIVLLFMKATRK